MLHVKINDKPLREVKHDELIDVFVELAFFNFMDRGRSGIVSAAADFIDTASEWLAVRFPGEVLKMNSLVYDEISGKVKDLLVTGFITSGSTGLRDGFRSSYLVVLDSLKLR